MGSAAQHRMLDGGHGRDTWDLLKDAMYYALQDQDKDLRKKYPEIFTKVDELKATTVHKNGGGQHALKTPDEMPKWLRNLWKDKLDENGALPFQGSHFIDLSERRKQKE